MSEILNILSSVGFNWHVALANFVNFLIILFLLNKFFFKKLGTTIKERHTIIERGLTQASLAEKALLSADEEKKSIVREARKEGEGIVIEAKEVAEKTTLAITREAQVDIDSKKEALLAQEAVLKDKVEKEFAQNAPSLVAKLYAKTLATEMTQESNDTLISRMSM
jgi:F-type H+-transporting ATPase subunit b